MIEDQKNRRPVWTRQPLYQFMLDIFPEHRTLCGFLDVVRLGKELGRSHEAVYKWLRKGKLTPQNAKAVLDLAASQSRLAGREPPTVREFDRFVYA